MKIISTRALAVAALLWAACSDGSAPADAPREAAADAARDVARDAAAEAAPTHHSGALFGRVVDPDGQGVADAIVRFGGRPEIVRSGADGRFTLMVADPPVPLRELALTAGKQGYVNAGIEVVDPSAEQRITLSPLGIADDPSYVFKEPDTLEATPHCLHCHHNHTTPWQSSGHRSAARRPTLHDLYNSTASSINTETMCTTADDA